VTAPYLVSPSMVHESPLLNAFKQLAFAAADAFDAEDIHNKFHETAAIIASSTPAKLDIRYAETFIEIASDIKRHLDCQFPDANDGLKERVQSFIDAASSLRQFLPSPLFPSNDYIIERDDLSCASFYQSDGETNEEPDKFTRHDTCEDPTKKFYRARKYAHKDDTDDDDYETDEWKQAAAAMSDEFLRSMPPDGQDYRLRYLQHVVYLIVQENEPSHVYRLNTNAYLAMPSSQT